MTPLAKQLVRRIAATGPMTIAEYMAECLLHPEFGYYSTRDPFGSAGDFTTAPEISQMFGELVGLCLAQAWLEQGSPSPVSLAELGPGRGTLMADVLRATAQVPGFTEAVHVHLVEASDILRERQRSILAGAPVTWHASAQELPDLPLLVIANEFFDALPIRQFVRTATAWRERVVGTDGERLILGLSAPTPLAMLDHRLGDTENGQIVELRPSAGPVIAELADRIGVHGGTALVVDYGSWRSSGDTLQAVLGHAFDDPLDHPGEADLTAHVDFEALALAAGGVAVGPMVTQGEFLQALGLSARAEVLTRRLTGPALDGHRAATRRLTAPDEMGTLFKAMCLYPIDVPLPPGFAP